MNEPGHWNDGETMQKLWLTTHVCALVRAVFAVRFSIAVPSLGEALAVATDKVLGRTRLPHCRRDRINIKVSRAYNSACLKRKVCEENKKNNKLNKNFASGANAMSQNKTTVKHPLLIYCIHLHSPLHKALISGNLNLTMLAIIMTLWIKSHLHVKKMYKWFYPFDDYNFKDII